MSDLIYQKIAGFFPGRWDHNYVATKLRTDPLYGALTEQLRDSPLPLLDVGCGLGLLAFFLRARGIDVPIHGLDYDERKIHFATNAAHYSGSSGLSFTRHDARNGLPPHLGNVSILDILHFFTLSEQETLLRLAAARVATGGRLIVRSGLRDASWRFRITVAGDWLAKATFWMKAGPTDYPCADDFHRILSPFGRVEITALWGHTPFNNHLIILHRSADD